jgi:hypothetical protein
MIAAESRELADVLTAIGLSCEYGQDVAAEMNARGAAVAAAIREEARRGANADTMTGRRPGRPRRSP